MSPEIIVQLPELLLGNSRPNHLSCHSTITVEHQEMGILVIEGKVENAVVAISGEIRQGTRVKSIQPGSSSETNTYLPLAKHYW
jgi:ribosomal protein L6P/L9E